MAVIDGLVKYAVGEKATNEAWGTLVLEVHKVHAVGGSDLREVLKNAEQEFKEKTGTGLPSAYRSAKSVILKALENGVPIITENDQPMGKTAVEKAIKAVMTKVAPEPSDMVCEAIELIGKAMALCVTESERVALRTYVQLNLPSVLGE